MAWTVTLSRKADKQKEKLPEHVRGALLFLIHEIMRSGPVRGTGRITASWDPRPTIATSRRENRPVAVWEEIGGEVRLVEVTYVGTHEKAPY